MATGSQDVTRPPVVALTRARSTDLETFRPLEARGVRLIWLPLTRQRDVDGGKPLVEALDGEPYTDLLVTSANGVRALGRALLRTGRGARARVDGATAWAVGPATGQALRDALGVEAAYVPARATGADLVALAGRVGVEGRRFLFPAAAGARRDAPDGLRALGAEVVEVVAYETIPDPATAARIPDAVAAGLDMVTLASPSAADALIAALARASLPLDRITVAAIGPTTERHCRSVGLEVAVVAEVSTMEGLREAIAAHVAGRGRNSEE